MSSNWAIRISLSHLHRAADLRSVSGIQAAVSDTCLWLRGEGLDDALQRTLAPIADGPVYEHAIGGRLTPFGHAVPTERLPDLSWQRLSVVLHPVLPAPQIPVWQLPRVPLTLERTAIVQQESVLVADWTEFRDWALSVPEIRIHACRFAVQPPDMISDSSNHADPRHVVILGHPLPPLSGERYWVAGCVAVPLGFRWSPFVDVATLEAVVRRTACQDSATQSVNLPVAGPEGSQNLFIWQAESNAMNEIASSDLIIATRTNVRATGDRQKSRCDSDGSVRSV